MTDADGWDPWEMQQRRQQVKIVMAMNHVRRCRHCSEVINHRDCTRPEFLRDVSQVGAVSNGCVPTFEQSGRQITHVKL